MEGGEPIWGFIFKVASTWYKVHGITWSPPSKRPYKQLATQEHLLGEGRIYSASVSHWWKFCLIGVKSHVCIYLGSPTASHASIAESSRLGLSGDEPELDQCRALLILDLDISANTVARCMLLCLVFFFTSWLMGSLRLVKNPTACCFTLMTIMFSM